MDLEEIRQRIANLVGNDAVGMVEITMEEVRKGHYLGMKYLFEMVGLLSGDGRRRRADTGFDGDDSVATAAKDQEAGAAVSGEQGLE